MLSRRRFHLTHSTLARPIDDSAQRRWLTVPTGAKLYVVSGPNVGDEDQMVHVRWEGCQLAMFAIDLTKDGTEIQEHARGAAS